MARMRTLKPGFFLNEVLAEIDPLGRLLFQGLWCLADREGRLEDRPRKIKAEILPYDDADIDGLLDTLVTRGFILRYEVDGSRYISVLTFKKHQSPHMKEAASTIPAPGLHGESTMLAPSLTLTGTVTITERESAASVVQTHERKAAEGEPLTRTRAQARPKKAEKAPARHTEPIPMTPKPPNPLWDVLVEVFYAPTTPPEKSNFGKIVKQLTAMGATPDDVRLRVKEHAKSQNHWELTPNALMNHWSTLAGSKRTGQQGNGSTTEAAYDPEKDPELAERRRVAAELVHEFNTKSTA